MATIIVVIDTPRGGTYFGGSVAAPIFRSIAQATLRHLGIPPSINPAPPVLVARRSPEIVRTRTATPPAIVTIGGAADAQVVPDVRGQSAREAVRTLTRIGLSARLHGDGLVVTQEPLPGTPAEPGASCDLWLERVPVMATSFRAQP